MAPKTTLTREVALRFLLPPDGPTVTIVAPGMGYRVVGEGDTLVIQVTGLGNLDSHAVIAECVCVVSPDSSDLALLRRDQYEIVSDVVAR